MDSVSTVRFRLVPRTDVNAISAGYFGDEVGFLQTSRSRRMIYAPNFFAGRIAQGNLHVDSSLLDRQMKIFGGFQFHRPTIGHCRLERSFDGSIKRYWSGLRRDKSYKEKREQKHRRLLFPQDINSFCSRCIITEHPKCPVASHSAFTAMRPACIIEPLRGTNSVVECNLAKAAHRH